MSKRRICFSASLSYLLVVLCRFLIDSDHFQTAFGWVSLGLIGLFVVGSGISVRRVQEPLDAEDALKRLIGFIPFSMLILVVLAVAQSPMSAVAIMDWFVAFFATPIYVGLVLRCVRTSTSEVGAADSKLRV